VILGCEHRVQLVDNETDPGFRELIEATLDRFGIRFIGEEGEQGRRSIAQEIAERRALRYRNIDIPHRVQNEIRLRSSMIFNKTKRLVEVVATSDRYVIAWNLVREHHMYKAFEEDLIAGEPSLLICGSSHVEGFCDLLGDKYNVVTMSFDAD
jgi:hypothetical protein